MGFDHDLWKLRSHHALLVLTITDLGGFTYFMDGESLCFSLCFADPSKFIIMAHRESNQEDFVSFENWA